MRVLVAGAGPAGLYFSYLARRRWPDWQIRVVEQNPPDATFGFGVVFSDRALILRADDRHLRLVTPQMEQWRSPIVHRGTPVVIGGFHGDRAVEAAAAAATAGGERGGGAGV
jgi:hypothetical protein